MADRVRIVDIAEELGVSTATVSNVIHGKTKKISDETVKRVQALLEERQYIPSMAGILLSRNDSRIVGVVVNNHEKYEGKVLEDGFVAASLNALLFELERAGYFMMVKATRDWSEVERFASMWNMDGMVLLGFCDSDYEKLREKMRIPFVVYDGFFEKDKGICNLTIDNFDGGRQMGAYLKGMGHRRALLISDNEICVDAERMAGFRAGFSGGVADFLEVPMNREGRSLFYQENLERIRVCTAAFAVSDVYAAEFMHFLMERGDKYDNGKEEAYVSCGLARYSAAGYLAVPAAVILRDGGSNYDRTAWKQEHCRNWAWRKIRVHLHSGAGSGGCGRRYYGGAVRGGER